jgi:uncharacterized damage-inducible protein DinB
MKPFFKELFEYNFTFNQKILQVSIENQDRISERLIKLHSHFVNVHGIWNNKIIPSTRSYTRWDIYNLKELIEIDRENYDTSISIIDGFSFDLQVQYSLSSGKSCNNSVRDILFQIINHSTYHRGQIATEFRLCNIEPLLTDWIFYKMN